MLFFWNIWPFCNSSLLFINWFRPRPIPKSLNCLGLYSASIKKRRITTFSIMTFSIMTYSIIINKTQHSADHCCAECHLCWVSHIVTYMVSVGTLSVVVPIELDRASSPLAKPPQGLSTTVCFMLNAPWWIHIKDPSKVAEAVYTIGNENKTSNI